MKHVKELYAYLVARDDGTEKPIAIVDPNGKLTPCVATSRENIEKLLPLVQEAVNQYNKPATLARFTERENLDIIPPNGEPNAHHP